MVINTEDIKKGDRILISYTTNDIYRNGVQTLQADVLSIDNGVIQCKRIDSNVLFTIENFKQSTDKIITFNGNMIHLRLIKSIFILGDK